MSDSNPAPLQLLQRLIPGGRCRSAEAALIQALPTADPETISRIANSFIASASLRGLEALIEQYEALPKTTQKRLTEQTQAAYPALRRIMSQGDAASVWHAAAYIQAADQPHLADLLNHRLSRSEDPAAPRVAQALLALHQAHGDHPAVSEAIDAAARAHSLHGLDALLTAGLHRLPLPAPKLKEALAIASSPTVQAARRLVRQAAAPSLRRRLLAVGRMPNMRQAVADGLAAVCLQDQQLDVLAQAHLLALHDSHPPIHRLPDARQLWPSAQQIAQQDAPPQALRNLPALAETLGNNARSAIRRLGGLRRCRDANTRLSAVRRLVSLSRAPQRDTAASAKQSLAGFALDPDPNIAAMVLRCLQRWQHPQLTEILEQLHASAQVHHRHLAQPFIAAQRYETLLTNWATTSAKRRQDQAIQRLTEDPQLVTRIGRTLATGTHDARMAGLSILTCCGLSQHFEQALIRLTRAKNRHIVASAVMALQGVETPAALAAIKWTTSHQDGRVRANAIEVAENCQDPATRIELTPQLQEHTADETPRPRANAIAALADRGQGPWLDHLRKMLHDQRDPHRVSAIWVAESRQILETADTLAECAASDPSPRVRSRAHRALQSLLAENQGPVVVASAPSNLQKRVAEPV